MNRKLFGIFGTLLVHIIALLLIFNFWSISFDQHSLRNTTSSPGKTTPTVVEILPPGGMVGQGDQVRDMTGSICNSSDHTYYGVGFLFDPTTGQVTDAPTFFPAYKAGIRVGDLMLKAAHLEADGYITLYMLHYGDQRPTIYHIKAISICFKTDA